MATSLLGTNTTATGVYSRSVPIAPFTFDVYLPNSNHTRTQSNNLFTHFDIKQELGQFAYEG